MSGCVVCAVLNGLTALMNLRCPPYALIRIFGGFPSKGGVKVDKDDYELVCALSGVLTPSGEEKRKKTFIRLPETQS